MFCRTRNAACNWYTSGELFAPSKAEENTLLTVIDTSPSRRCASFYTVEIGSESCVRKNRESGLDFFSPRRTETERQRKRNENDTGWKKEVGRGQSRDGWANRTNS